MQRDTPKDGKRGLGLEPGNAARKVLKGKSWFFGVGIDQYAHFAPLHNAVKDVKELLLLLQDQYGFDPGRSITLFDEQATRDNIIDELDALVGKVTPEDKLLIYFSGHGHLNKATNLAYWIPQDARKNRTSGYISNSTVRDYIKAIPSLHTLLISDSCFSGALFVRGAGRSDAAEELEQRRSRWGIVSGRHDEEVYDGEPGTNSPFAASILKVLSRNRDAKMNVARLADRVVEMTRSNYEQLPEGNPLFGVGHDGGQYVFRLAASESNLWERCRAEHSLAAYNDYLDQFPDGRHADEALQHIRELEEESAWQQAVRIDKIYGYRTFLQSFPAGKFGAKARQRIRQLQQAERENEERNDWDTVKGQKSPEQHQFSAAAAGPVRSATSLWKQYLAYGAAGTLLLVLFIMVPKWGQGGGAELAGGALIPFEDGAGYGYKAKDGTVVIEPQFDYAYPFAGSRARVEKDSMMGLIDPQGNIVVNFQYRYMEPFVNNRALVARDNRYGFIDTSGAVVIPLEFDNAGSFDETGEAYVVLYGREMHIDKDGKCVRNCPPEPEDLQSATTPNDPDENTWEEAVLADQLASYQAYLQSFPAGKYAATAKQRITGIHEAQEWQDILRENTVRAYIRFMNKYPEGKYAADARRRMNDLKTQLSEKEAAAPFPKKGAVSLGGKTYPTIQFKAGGLIWMTQNLDYESADSWCYENDPSNCNKYGRLYTWEAAKKACQAVGRRLPTDQEWRALTKDFGGAATFDASDHGAAAYQALIAGGSSGFSAQLGGFRSDGGSFGNLGSRSSYWSATEGPGGWDSKWTYNFSRPNGTLYRYTSDKIVGISCRCVQD